MKTHPLESASDFSNSLNMKTPMIMYYFGLVKSMNQWHYQALFSPLFKLVKNEERLELNFLDSLKFNRKDKEEVFFWFSVGGSRSSLNITLSVLFDTHVSVFTFSSSITSSFLLLHFFVIPGESDHVSYMIDKSSCIIYKVKIYLGSSLCRAHCSRI